MHITAYINKLRDERGDDKDIIELTGIIEAWKSLCEEWYYMPTQRHAGNIFTEIIDWEVEGK